MTRSATPWWRKSIARELRLLFDEAGDVVGCLRAGIVNIRLWEKAGRPREAVQAYREVVDALNDPSNGVHVAVNTREVMAITAAVHVSLVYLNVGEWQEAVDALTPVRGRLETLGYDRNECKVRLHLGHALSHLGRFEEAAAEYRALFTATERVPEDLAAEARAGLAALASGSHMPPTHFS
jgi:tetratricopeptide (TPR) repeat protein